MFPEENSIDMLFHLNTPVPPFFNFFFFMAVQTDFTESINQCTEGT